MIQYNTAYEEEGVYNTPSSYRLAAGDRLLFKHS